MGTRQGFHLGRYVVGPRLAVGGMGEVYCAVQVGLGGYQKPIALKLLLPHLAENERAVAMFLGEARLAARMSHANVVQIFDVGREAGRYFIAMELVSGISLSVLGRRLAEARRSLSPGLIAYVARALCDGLHHAHELRDEAGTPLQMVHCDVSPQNVLLSTAGDVKLTDFGIAKVTRPSPDAHAATVMGKAEYIAPEQARGQPADRRADIFGLGLTLFQLAAQVSPFHRATEAASVAAVMDEPLPDLAALRPDLPAELVSAIGRASEKDPERRFPTARALREALPPPSTDAGAEQLGELVRQVCRREVTALESKTHVTATLGSAEVAGSVATSRPSASRRARLWVGAALGLAALGAVAAWLGGRPPVALEAAEKASPADAAVVQAEAPSPPALATRQVAEPAPAPSEPKARPRVRAVAAPKAGARASPKQGYLTIDAVPWGVVFINGKRVGETPLASYPVDSGEVSVTLSNPETGKTVVHKVTVAPGQREYLRQDLQ